MSLTEWSYCSSASIFPERNLLEHLDTEDKDQGTDARQGRQSDYGNFLNLLHNTMDFAAKTKSKSRQRVKSPKDGSEETFLRGNAKLYLQVKMYCKRWRLKTEQNLHSK